MEPLPGYQNIRILSKSETTIVSRALPEGKTTPCILKYPRYESPDPSDNNKYQREYEILCSLDIPGVISPLELYSINQFPVLLLEDIGSDSLKILFSQKPSPLKDFLKIAIKIVTTLEQVHSAEIIHNHLTPDNIIYNPKSCELRLIDFTLASKYHETHSADALPNPMMLDLFCLSPEQTGRMSTAIDYRTDFYSLGVTFYWMLTGNFPFSSTDPLNMIHSHLAEHPPAIRETNPTIPKPVIAMITRLMAKNPDERYQSCRALEADLKKWLRQVEQSDIAPVFTPLSSSDTGALQIPSHIHGRNDEKNTLLKAFGQTATSGKELVMISGAAGMGKTALVRNLKKTVTEQNGFFISGKFNQFHNDINSNGVPHALRTLVDELLTGEEYQFKQWKEKINRVLKENGALLLEMIPELAIITDSQDLPAELHDEEKKQLFPFVFQNFIAVFASKEHPLTIFIDDLQWATAASLELVRLIAIADEIQHVLIIGAYRDNEVGSKHPLLPLLQEIQKSGMKIKNIALSPLEYSDIRLLVANSIHQEPEQCDPLAKAVAASSMGNPFFITEFLTSINKRNYLWFNFQKQIWEWDIESIGKLKVSDKVVPLVVDRILSQSRDVRELLKYAACLGGGFDAPTLALICETDIVSITSLLKEAVQEGLIRSEKLTGWYEFPHDRIQQAAYTMMAMPERNRHHYHIGKRLLQGTLADQHGERIITIVNQLNRGIECIDTWEEKKELVELNLLAGRKAKSAFAYEQALEYYSFARHLYDDWCKENYPKNQNSSWQVDYSFTLNMYEQTVEAAFLTSNYKELDILLSITRNNISTPLDEARLITLRIKKLHGQNKLLEAVHEAINFCGRLGVVMPKNPNKLHIITGYLKTKLLLSGKNIADLANLPEMTDPKTLAVYNALSTASMAAYAALPNLAPLIVFTGINLSLKHGNCHNSIFGYAGYGLFLCNIIGDYKTGGEYGELALNLIEKLNAREMKARTIATVYGFNLHWQRHNREISSPLQGGFQDGINTGDYQYGATCAFQFCMNSFLLGENLNEVEQSLLLLQKQVKHLRQDAEHSYSIILGHTVSKLTGSNNSFSLAYSFFPKTDNRILLLREAFCNMIIAFLFYQPDKAIEYAEKGYKYSPLSGNALAVDVVINFYHSLALLHLEKKHSRLSKKKRIRKVISNQKKLSGWAAVGPMNHEHKYNLVQAEYYRVTGEPNEAETFYKLAIRGASANSYINEEALANELAARFYLEQDNRRQAKISMMRSHRCYYKWGAVAKVRDMEKRYPDLFSQENTVLSEFGKATSTSPTHNLKQFDWLSVFKSCQALSGEIFMDKLLNKMMHLVLENSGAGYGCLILTGNGGPVIKSEMSISGKTLDILQNTPLSPSTNLPLSIINYVLRAMKPVLCDNISLAEKYGNDPYIRTHNPRSILSLPIMLKSDLFGLLYLENRLTSGTFTEHHLDILTMLSTQMAVSLENAALFAENEKRAKEQIEQEKQINKEKEHIIQDLHDGIGGSLVHIKTLSEMIRDESNESAQYKKAELVAELAAESLTELRGLFRSLDPTRADWQSVISDMSHYGNRVLEGHNIDFEMNSNVDKSSKLPDGLFSLVLFNICREALNNVIKHSQATRVTIEIMQSPDSIFLKICDNGLGLTNRSDTGRGIGIMKKRAHEIDADITIDGNKGVTISLTLPLLHKEY